MPAYVNRSTASISFQRKESRNWVIRAFNKSDYEKREFEKATEDATKRMSGQNLQ